MTIAWEDECKQSIIVIKYIGLIQKLRDFNLEREPADLQVKHTQEKWTHK